jgi:HEAT repeat protein
MSKNAYEQKLAALESLGTPAELRKALCDRNNFYVSKAAAMVANLGFRDLIPELAAAFDRFLVDPAKADPQCWAKNAIAKTLKDFDHDDASLYLRGMKHIQLEPVWGGVADTAATLRGTCALALANCSIPRGEALRHLVDLLGADKEKTVRMDSARAIAQLGGVESVLLLRLKVLAGDREPDVTGQCFAGLLSLAPGDYIPFVAGFLRGDDDVRFEAAATLGELPDPAAIVALAEHFRKSKNPETRRAILLSLGASRLEAARDFLLSTLVLTSTGGGGIEEAIASIRALGVSRFRDEVRDRVRSAADERAEPKLGAAFQKEFNS